MDEDLEREWDHSVDTDCNVGKDYSKHKDYSMDKDHGHGQNYTTSWKLALKCSQIHSTRGCRVAFVPRGCSSNTRQPRTKA